MVVLLVLPLASLPPIGAQVIAKAMLGAILPFHWWAEDALDQLLPLGWGAKVTNNEVEPITDKLGYYFVGDAKEEAESEHTAQVDHNDDKTLAPLCGCLCSPSSLHRPPEPSLPMRRSHPSDRRPD